VEPGVFRPLFVEVDVEDVKRRETWAKLREAYQVLRTWPDDQAPLRSRRIVNTRL
jgi:hypothetical protein